MCVLPLQSLGQRLLQVGGGRREGELDGDAAAVVEDGGQLVSFGRSQDSQLVVGLACRTHPASAHTYRSIQGWQQGARRTTHHWMAPAGRRACSRTRPGWSGCGSALKDEK